MALTDQFRSGDAGSFHQGREILPRLHDEYDCYYYAGIIWERRATARLSDAAPGSGCLAYPWLCKAMAAHEQAEAMRPRGKDDALLRWNTCVRLNDRNHLHPEPAEQFEPALE